MTLNCKKGDLARVVSDPETVASGMADKILQVTEPVVISGVRPGWLYSGPAHICVCGCGCAVNAVADCLLRPIRGGEGDDQTLAWAGLPASIDAPVTA